ncbi:MAG: hypothetical protein MJZ72_09450 [Bacteroidales bacterium]|nr:hypothetical protein [Bacteroidales bacterium]
MNDIYNLFKHADRKTIELFLSGKSAFEVLRSYEIAFGSPQLLAYERDTLAAIIDKFLSSDEESQLLFCEHLEKGISIQNIKAKRKAERQIRRLEFRLQFKCFLTRIFRRHDIADSLWKQYFGHKIRK